jgi:hypothetical protein
VDRFALTIYPYSFATKILNDFNLPISCFYLVFPLTRLFGAWGHKRILL